MNEPAKRTFESPDLETIVGWIGRLACEIAGLDTQHPVWYTTRLGEASTGVALATNRFAPLDTYWGELVSADEVRVVVRTFYQGHVLASIHPSGRLDGEGPGQSWTVENAFRPFDRWG